MVTLFCIRPKGYNIGNDVIFMGLRHFIEQAFGRTVNLITLPATSRYDGSRAGLSKQTVHEINQYGHGVIVGGGNLYENGELDLSPEALKALAVPLLLFSLSRGRIYNAKNELVDRTDVMPDSLLKVLNNRTPHALARDTATNQYLHSLGCTHSRVGGCPTLFLDKILAKTMPSTAPQKREGVLLSVRNPNLMNIPLKKQIEVFNHVTGMIKLLKKRGYKKVTLLCHDHRDVSFAASFPDTEYLYTSDTYTYFNFLKTCELNVTFRLHSALPCAALDTPFIKISYDERALSLMDTVGLNDWNIDLVKSQDPIKDVDEKIEFLKTCQPPKVAAKQDWERVGNEMTSTFSKFSADVNSYKDSLSPKSKTRQQEIAA